MCLPTLEIRSSPTARVVVAILALIALPSSLHAADRFNPRDGWSLSSPTPHLDATRQIAAGSAESLWAERESPTAISRPTSTLRVRRVGGARVSSPGSNKTDREQRIVLSQFAADQVDSLCHSPGGDGNSEYDIQPTWFAEEADAPELPERSDPNTTTLHGDAILPAGHNVFYARTHGSGNVVSGDEACTPVGSEEIYYDDCGSIGCDVDCCDGCLVEPCCSCGSNPCICAPEPRFAIGVELVSIKPRFDDNVAFTVMESDGANNDTFNDAEFDYDPDWSARVWMGCESCSGLGGRATYWHFNQLGTTSSAMPPDNGFGFILHPVFGDVDISTNVPTDTFTASSTVEAFAVDLEMTKRIEFPKWSAVASGGLRYAEIEQSYFAQRRQQDDTLLGTIDFAHHLKGIGPTVAVRADRSLIGGLSGFSSARGSLLFGDGESHLAASEGPATGPPLTTTQNRGRDDLLPIGEMQVGLHWQGKQCKVWRPFLTAALEGQIWGGAGNASSEEGSVGFFGVSLGGGSVW